MEPCSSGPSPPADPLSNPSSPQDDELNRVAFSPDGSVFATAHHGGYARLWDTRTGRPRGQPLKHDDSVQDLAFSADGKLLITGSTDKTVRIWHVPSGAPFGQPLKGHLESVNAVAFSPDGKLAASGSDDQTVRLWDVPTGRPVGHPLTGHPNAVETVAFSRDGKVLVSAGQDRLIKFWDVATGSPRGPDITWHSAAIHPGRLQSRRPASGQREPRRHGATLACRHAHREGRAVDRPDGWRPWDSVQPRRASPRNGDRPRHRLAVDAELRRLDHVRVLRRRSQPVHGRVEPVCPGHPL